MQPVTEKIYGIPPEQVMGSSVVSEFQIKEGKPVLVRMPKVGFVNDKAGKPVGIYEHTDADREYAYDRKSHVGKLDKALDQADANDWIIVDMKKDWKSVFPPPPK